MALQGTDKALHNRHAHLKVTWIRRNRHRNVPATFPQQNPPFCALPEVIFHIADPEIALVTLHLRTQGAKWFAKHVVQHIEPSPMGHANLEACDACGCCIADKGVNGWDNRFASLEAKAFAGGELLREETLKRICMITNFLCP